MVAFLITSFLVLAGISYALYLWQRPSSNQDTDYQLPPARAAGLFDDDNPAPPLELTTGETAEQRHALIARAREGDKTVLEDAHATADTTLYDEVLHALIDHANSDKSLLGLISYIVRSEAHLRVNRKLAERFVESWKNSPDRNSTAKMLHIAALAGDANLYQTAIETAYLFWSDRRLLQISADELRQLIESEFWILAPEVRNSGAGFVLKRKLAQLRRKLVAAELD